MLMFQFLHVSVVAVTLGPNYDGSSSSTAFTNPEVASAVAHNIFLTILIFRSGLEPTLWGMGGWWCADGGALCFVPPC